MMHVHLAGRRLEGAELFPLALGHESADAQEHARVRFFKLCASLGEAIDLGVDLRFVGMFGLHERFHHLFLLMQSGMKLSEGGAVLLEDFVHSFLLIRGEVQLLRDVGVVPPFARRDMHAMVEAKMRRAETFG